MWLGTLAFAVMALITCMAIQQQDITSPSSAILNINDLETLNNFTAISNQVNGVLKSLNLSDIQVNIILNTAAQAKQFTSNNDLDSLKYLFEKTITSDWYEKDSLQRHVKTTGNITVIEILYEVLWQELKQNRYKSNPSQYIILYEDIQGVLLNYTSDKLSALQTEVQSNIIEYSSQVLRSYFIQNSTIQNLLQELKSIIKSNIYERSIEKLFEKLDTIEDENIVFENLLYFDSNTTEAVLNHIKYIKYIKFANENNRTTFYNNLALLMSRPDFTNIPLEQRQQSSKSLPQSMGNLFRAQTICIKNITTDNYLHECPNSNLMCTDTGENRKNRKKATFEIKRIGNKQYILRSPHWGRYLQLQGDNSTSTSSTSSATPSSVITKNLYGKSESSNWLIGFQGNFATIQDPSKSVFVCGSDPSHWGTNYKAAYTRKSNAFNNYRNECIWLLEDCSDVK